MKDRTAGVVRRRIVAVVVGVCVSPIGGLTLGSAAALAPAPAPGARAAVQQLERLEPVDPQAVDRALDDILSRPAFGSIRPETFWERVQRRVGDWIGRILARLLEVGLRGGPWSVVVTAALVGLFVGAGVVFSRRRAAAQAEQRAVHRLFEETGTDPEVLLRRADQAAASQSYSESVRFRFLAGLILLAQSGRIDLQPATTVEMAAAQLDDPVFDELTQTFEVVFYGDQAATDADERSSRDGWGRLLGRRVSSAGASDRG